MGHVERVEIEEPADLSSRGRENELEPSLTDLVASRVEQTVGLEQGHQVAHLLAGQLVVQTDYALVDVLPLGIGPLLNGLYLGGGQGRTF